MQHWQTDLRCPQMTTVESSARNMQRPTNTFQPTRTTGHDFRQYTAAVFWGGKPAVFMNNTNTHLLNILDSFKTNNPHFYPYLTSGRVFQSLWLRGWNPSPSNVLLHAGSHVRNIAL